jgi:hypothetical protein
VDVEFKEVVEVVREGGDRAGYRFGDAVVQGERAGCLVAGVEWDVLKFAEIVGDLFAIVSDALICVS